MLATATWVFRMEPKSQPERLPLTKDEQDSWLLRAVERRMLENASLRRWVDLGDKGLETTDESRRRWVTRENAKHLREESKTLRSAVQETKRKARKSRTRASEEKRGKTQSR